MSNERVQGVFSWEHKVLNFAGILNIHLVGMYVSSEEQWQGLRILCGTDTKKLLRLMCAFEALQHFMKFSFGPPRKQGLQVLRPMHFSY